MIKFFRKIRYELLEKNKTGTYLKYAIGEIVLVVIGILIALQINNWNQKKLLVKKEIEVLKTFQTQFKEDINQFDESLAFYGAAKNSIEIIIYHLENNPSYNDSLAQHFFTSTRFYGDSDLDNNVFENLKSLGVSLISNKDIRKIIVSVYEDDDEWINNFENDYKKFLYDASQNLFNTRFKDYLNGDYRDSRVQGEMIPIDFERLRTDQKYLYFIRTQKHQIGWLIEKPIEETKLKVIALSKDLEEEIKRLENK
ncbi:DUF6090 family protein [Maribacter antarcticus]|uniref:DUF6090 family protein n=1 Tax=Maribacter antarcticus TaxID=505250 RepID=UPI000688ED93|nr:DUF6090 family protein [Maribacter antarcticus]